MILCFTSRLNPMGLWCALDETYSASGFLYMDDGESIGMLTWLDQIIVIVYWNLVQTPIIPNYACKPQRFLYQSLQWLSNEVLLSFFSPISDSYTTGKYLELKFELKEVCIWNRILNIS